MNKIMELKEIYRNLLYYALLIFISFFSTSTIAQETNYVLTKSENASSNIVRLTIKIYSKNKNTVMLEAQKAAIKIVLFNGCPNTQYNKPLLENGEITAYQNHINYFKNLYEMRYKDFVSNCIAKSKFKKADKDKATLFDIEIKVLQLRKDLEKNGIKRKMGI